ncbi:MAG: hypothetical protein A3F12_01630 [Gammaproteobacteria bacterium RIFCSPHIGHO2_12_FULL_38_14]|nr:MAG: hypothetical protein A3F12_01630 [Gammaproteobacteria bacterium RIFCSPHIGHO2_12_FULL_38_14]
MLKPQDIVILLKILSSMALLNGNKEDDALSQNKLAMLLCMSPSEINAGIKRLVLSGLLGPTLKNDAHKKIIFLPIKEACLECLISAVKYSFPAQLGAYTRGIPTAYAAPLFKKLIVLGTDPIPVWPHAEGDKRGFSLEPLYASVPSSLIKYPDPLFYELLVLIDTIRIGKAREKNIAIKLLREKLDDKR